MDKIIFRVGFRQFSCFKKHLLKKIEYRVLLFNQLFFLLNIHLSPMDTFHPGKKSIIFALIVALFATRHGKNLGMPTFITSVIEYSLFYT
jgi:hypothetical protein